MAEDPAELLREAQERSAQLESYAALRQHLHRLTVLHQVSTRIVSALDPEEVIAGVLDALEDLLPLHTAAVYLVDLDVAVPAEGPRTVTPAGTAPRLRATRPVAPREPWSSAAEEAVAAAMRAQHSTASPLPNGLSRLVVPLVAGGRGLGALAVVQDQQTPLGTDEVKVLELLAATAAVAVQNALLYQETQRLATTDPLTGLSNYRHFHALLALEVQRARRLRYPLGLLAIDLDHFKVVNDRHGHQAGDQALRQVADVLRKRLRRTDIVARVGGDEFAVLLPGDGPEAVEIVAEDLRAAVAAHPAVTGGMVEDPTPVTLSVGGVSLPPDVLEQQLLRARADRALYDAKRSGRNQVKLWRTPLASPACRSSS